jgi:hypothetical protein
MYVNDTSYGAGYTDEDSVCGFTVTIYEGGLYFFRAQSSWGKGWLDFLYEDSNNVTFAIIAEAKPVFLLFTVQPEEFRQDTPITLRATVFNATSNQPLPGFEVWFYWCAENGTCGTVGHDLTNMEGVVSVSWTYPDDGGVYVFWACVNDAQQIVSSPVQLTVGKATRLLLTVTRDESSAGHVVCGWLKWGSSGVADKTVKIKVNETGYSVNTDGSGYFSLSLNLQPENNTQTAYMIVANFEGDEAVNAMAWTYMLDGSRYAACTTVQYGFKPASNTTWLTVEPQTADG